MRLLSFAFLMVALGVQLAAQVPGQAIGRIVDAVSGQPIGGATIEILGRAGNTRSDVAGRFVLRGLEPQGYTLRARAFGYLAQDQAFEISNGRATTIELALEPAAARLDSVVVRADVRSDAVMIERASIAASGWRDVSEVLQSVPGVVVTTAGGPGAPSKVSIRGSSASQVLVLVDGVSVNSPLSGEADLSRLSLEHVERITIIHGASSARYGARALGGAILIETQGARRTASIDGAVGAWNERSLHGSIGTAGQVAKTRLSGSFTADTRTADGNFEYDVPTVRGGGVARRVNGASSTSTFGGAGELTRGQFEARLRGSMESTSRGVPGSIVQPSLTGTSDERRATAGASTSAPLGAWTWSTNADVTRDHGHFVDLTPPFGGRYDNLLTATQTRVSTEATAAAKLGTLTFGVEHRTLGLEATMLDSAAPGSQRLTGVWSNLEVEQPGGALTVGGALGARLDWDSLIRGSEASSRGTLWIDRGIVRIAGSLGRAFSPPTLADQYFHEGVLVRANPSLEPERVRGDMELRASLRDVTVQRVALRAEVAAFRADVDGMILWSPDFRFVWSPSNFDVRRSGFEATAGLSTTLAGTALDVQGILSRADVTYTGSVLSGQVMYRPRTTGSVRTTFGRGSLRTEVETRYVGPRRTVAGSDVNALESYWLTDLTLVVPVLRRAWAVDATTTISNLFDRPAAMLVDYPFPGRGWRVALRARRAPSAH